MAGIVVVFGVAAGILLVVASCVRIRGHTDGHHARAERETVESDEPAEPARQINWKPAVVLVVSLAGLGTFAWWALWGNQTTKVAGGSDRWLNFALGLAGIATAAGVAGGAYLAARYGRRASISIRATVEALDDGGVIIAARPVVKAVGLFRVNFHGPRGALVRVREHLLVDPDESPTGMKQGLYWELVAVFEEQFAEAGEELATTVLFRLPPARDRKVVGWIVAVAIESPTRWMPGSSGAWGDKIFVARPQSILLGKGENDID
jgi:hypothetical protein